MCIHCAQRDEPAVRQIAERQHFGELTMRGQRRAGWAIGIVLVMSASVARGQSTGEASVRLNGVPVIQVTASGDESAMARAARIERRLERLADRVEETARPTVVRGPTDDTRVVQAGEPRS